MIDHMLWNGKMGKLCGSRLVSTLGWSLGLLWLLPSLALAEPAGEAGEGPDPGSEAEQVVPPVDLDRLLTLPSSYVADGERRGGARRGEWRTRFLEARDKVAEAEVEVARLQTKLEGISADSASWSAGAPGLSNPDPQSSPLSYGLLQQIRHAREAVEAAERELRELDVNADLAAVPESWRE